MSLYWQSMRLTYDPFMAEQANQTPFVSPKWEQQLDLLVHLATSQDSMLLVLGVSGIGKSTMMRQFIETLGHSGGICKIHGGATITTDVLQDLIARHLGFALSQQEPEQFSSQLLERMGRMRAEGHDFYLVIDNAHKLPKASLALLLELVEIQGGDHHPIHIMLFGGPQLEALIGDITSQHLGEVLTHSIHLEPLTLDYLKNYVEQRLNLAGFDGALPFTQNQLQQIFQISGGIPAKVNSLSRQLLLQWTQQGSKKSGDKRSPAVSINNRRKPLSVYWYGGAAFAVVAVVLLIMFYFNTPSANAVGNQTLMVNANKDTTQDYDEAGSESSANPTSAPANSQANAAMTAASASSAVPDSSYTEVDSDGNSTAGAASVASANASQDPSQNVVAANTSVDSANRPGADNTASANGDTAATSDVMVNSDDGDANVGSDAQAQSTSTSQTVNQALADNASLTKQSAPASHTATAMALSTQVALAPSQVSAKPVSLPQTNANTVTTRSPVVAAAQDTNDAEYIPSGSQIPMNNAAVATHPMAALPAQAEPAAFSASGPKGIASPAKTAAPVKTSAVKAKAKPVTTTKTGASLDASYFKAQPTSRVVLQIAGSRDLGKLRQQVASYGLAGRAHYFKTTMNGGPWYVATYGNYPSMAIATNAKSSLPAAALATKPWPRSFQSIQAAINIG